MTHICCKIHIILIVFNSILLIYRRPNFDVRILRKRTKKKMSQVNYARTHTKNSAHIELY